MDAARFSKLLNLLYEGVLTPSAWKDFVNELCAQTGCDMAAVTLHDFANLAPDIGLSVGIPDRTLDEWKDYFGPKNPRTKEIGGILERNGQFLSTGDPALWDSRVRDGEYSDWQIRRDLYYSTLMVVKGTSGIASVSLMRSRSQKPFGPREVSMVKPLMPHIRRVFEIHSHNQALRAVAEAERMALDRLDAAVLAMDDAGRVMAMNECAERILSRAEVVGLSNGKLFAADPPDSKKLEMLVTTAAKGAGSAVTLRTAKSAIPWTIIATPFLSDRIFSRRRPCALIFILDPLRKPASRSASLRTFGLTPAECRLANLLHEGIELRRAAERSGMTFGTARFTLKTVFQKTGTHRQSQLMRLLSSLPGESL